MTARRWLGAIVGALAIGYGLGGLLTLALLALN